MATRPRVWKNKESTSAWVKDQTYAQDKKTRQWVYDQQIRVDGYRRLHADDCHRRKEREEMVYTFKVEAERWLRHEEEMKRLILQMEREKARRLQREQREREERARRSPKEAESAKERTAPRTKQTGLAPPKANTSIRDAWSRYEQRWAGLVASPAPIRFRDIPWPLDCEQVKLETMSIGDIQDFILSKEHSEQQTPKERIRNAQLRWHPDRFSRLMSRVVERDRTAVQDGVNVVAKALNDAMNLIR